MPGNAIAGTEYMRLRASTPSRIESLDELQEDLASLRALEFMDVALYSLEGLLWGRDGTWPDDMAPTRPHWEDWAASFLH